ncbi:exonuclease I, 3'--_ 5'-specific; deoxyribophosphodiesterase [Xenorhabdus bovienii str. oregonense]|uniref:Exodeoxyribonuclease I n=1 Tax=Xenorhabdus bovienii str. oregonense TaxID=1398202 RepID=A0A077P3W5_XENBV|nr:exodeoxyribonuclease I [Xenorhabdus bovienii]CDH05765.1 exonuclease I, 3'--> 5'-specific; deoxyribophosphodiesterase [Xenorhabdus bovienii str. oregonense]
MSTTNKQPSFYFQDYETFGKHPALDRPAQFAGIRTDSDFNIIEEPLVVYCSPADDYLPDPEAVMITGITPQLALKKGVNEAEFARQIHEAFSKPNTCIIGYNNIRFDDEVSRNIFYRNFYDPYAYSWQKGNSRWDLLDVLRACYALRPEGIIWPENDDGLPSFKLENLTKANGVEHTQAHDAMSDVYATIAMAKRVKKAQPRLFDYFFQLRNKQKVSNQIDIPQMKPLVHVSGMFGTLRSNISLIAPLAWHPTNRNAVIMCDLAGDISPLLELSADELCERLYTRRNELQPGQAPVPIKLIHINKCPIIAPENTLRTEDAERVGLNRDQCAKNLAILRSTPQIKEKVVELFSQPEEFPESDNVDTKLYSGFFSDADKTAMEIIRETAPKNLPALDLTFQDPRIKTLLFRYRARNYPATLNYDEQQRWLYHRREILTQENISQYLATIEQLFVEYQSDEEKCRQLKSLVDYAVQLAS